jgi:hypothetical protein
LARVLFNTLAGKRLNWAINIWDANPEYLSLNREASVNFCMSQRPIDYFFNEERRYEFEELFVDAGGFCCRDSQSGSERKL